jgi:branched-chain amino acid transport system ATP-binding protein
MFFEISGLTVNYGGAQILKGINLQVEEGQVVTLIGSNGAGKTTTLRTVSGLKSPATGEIRFCGERIDRLPSQAIVKRGIIQVPQGRGLFPYMSVSENLKLGAFLRSHDDTMRAEMRAILDRFSRLKERGNQLAGTLSGGEQQLLAIACALMGRPKLLLLDEPSSGLSPIAVKEIGKAIAEVNASGTSILLVEQNARLALRLAHRAYVLETGSIVLSGPAEDLMASEHVKRAYLGQ